MNINDNRFSRSINRQIEEAQKSGAFDNLPGKGKPLKLTSNANADPETELAFKLLQDNQYTLPWIEKGQQIDKALAAARESLSQSWDLLQRSGTGEQWAQDEWARAKNVFRERIVALNRLIRDYNLEIPNLRFERFILDADAEIGKVQGP